MALMRRQGLAVGLGLAIFSAFSASQSARGQISPDPYKPYNAQYEQYVYPSYPGELGVTPNQSLLQGAGGGAARNYQRYLEAEDEFDRSAPASSVGPRRRGVGVPYYSAYREDTTYNREYTPNKTADKKYLASRRTRDEIYSQYLAATDPKKKEQLRKEYNEASAKALRELNDQRSAVARGGGSTARNAANTPSRPATPGTGATGRRTDRPTGTPPDERSPSGARPSNTEILNRSQGMDRRSPGPRRPEPPPRPRPSADDDKDAER